jgi:hypothetical protein
MSASLHYLEADEIDQLAARLERQGYTVQRDYPAGAAVIDLVASKPNERIGFEVTARANLQEAREQLRHLRQQAVREGFTDFRLVVVSPPHQTSVSVEGLDRALVAYLMDHVPEPLQHLASTTRIEGVTKLEMEAITLTRDGTELTGTGVVEVALVDGGSRDAEASPDAFPFRFHVLLGPDLRLRRVEELTVDVSGDDE